MIDSTRFVSVLQCLLLVFNSIEPKGERAFLEYFLFLFSHPAKLCATCGRALVLHGCGGGSLSAAQGIFPSKPVFLIKTPCLCLLFGVSVV